MFWIRVVLIRIRIQIRGSVPLVYGSGSGPSLFFSGFQQATKKCVFPLCLLLSVGTFTSVAVLRSPKGIEIFFFSCRCDGRIRIRTQETEKYRLRIWIRNTASKQYSKIMRPSLSGAALFFFYEAILSLHFQIG